MFTKGRNYRINHVAFIDKGILDDFYIILYNRNVVNLHAFLVGSMFADFYTEKSET